MNNRPILPDLEQMIAAWTEEELRAFFCCVRSSEHDVPPSSRDALQCAALEQLFWAYNSRTFAETKRMAAQATITAYDLLPEFVRSRMPRPDLVSPQHEYAKSLTYDFLLREASEKFKIKDFHCEPVNRLEIYLFETIISRILVEMDAETRHQFLTRKIQFDVMAAEFHEAGWAAPVSTLAGLAAAQASGFGVYMGATTALGLISHAVGVTLPFAVYTGMTSTIAFVIGPAGFLATAGWLAYVFTSPEWQRITRGILHVIAMKAKYTYSQHALITAGAGYGAI